MFAASLGGTCTLCLVACSSFLMLPANIDIVRRRYDLSAADIRQIQDLPVGAGINKPIRSIQARSATEVWVSCGQPWLRDAEMTSFTAQRKNGRWFIVKASLYATRAESVTVE